MIIDVGDIIIRVFLAVLVGGTIGYERESHNRAAGFRTHILVCLGATIVSLIQINTAKEALEIIGENQVLANAIKVDLGRLGAQVITGVGFLGAGTIMYTKDSIKGLTTAASLWVVAALGLAVGMGYYNIVLVGSLGSILTLGALKRFQYKFITKIIVKKIEVEYEKGNNALEFIEDIILAFPASIERIQYNSRKQKFDNIEHIKYIVEIDRKLNCNRLLSRIKDIKGVLDVSIR